MDSNAIQIVVRVRPFHPDREVPFLARPINQHFFLGDGNFASSPRKAVSNGSIRQVIDVCDNRMLDFDKPEVGAETRRGQPGAKRYKNRQYLFDAVLKMEVSQEEVFEKTALPLIDGVLTGFNATVFAYGATGCGKTHTISGTPEDPGIIIRTTAELFRRIDETKDDYDTHIEVSMVEIYNETIRDLLAPEDKLPPKGGLKLQENEKERVNIEGVTLLRPKTVDEVMQLVQQGNLKRSTQSTAMNAVSSRSHAVLQINIGRNSKGHEIDMASASVQQCMSSATLSIIDLAGSERAAATQNMGARMREGANINKSLLALSSCIAALCERPTAGQKPHIPYRNSKLTRMLKFSLGGNCRTVMVVCVSPSSRDIEDTNNTLVWANKAKNVSTKVTRNTQGVDVRVQQYLEAIQRLNLEVAALKKEIAEIRNGEKTWTDNRRLKDREDCQKAVNDVADMITGSMAALTDGAGKRAGWDGAEMLVAALKEKLLEAQGNKAELEIGLFSSVIRQQDLRYKNDATTINAIQKEANQKASIDGVLSNLEQRKFGPSTHPADLDNVRTHVQLKRAEVDRAIMEAREKVYRQSAMNQAHALATAASMLHQLSTGVAAQSQALADLAAAQGVPGFDGISEELANLGESSKSALSNLFRSAAGGVLPDIPSAIHLGKPLRPIHDSNDPFSADGNTSTASARGTSKSSRSQPRSSIAQGKRPAVLASPAGKRLLGAQRAKLPGSPVRKVYHASTPKRKGARTIVVKPKPAISKGVTWRDEAGAGDLEHMKVMTSDSSSGNIFSSGDDADASGDWDEEEVVAEKPPVIMTLPKRVLPDPVRPPVIRPPSGIPRPSPPSQASSSSIRKGPSPLQQSTLASTSMSMPPPALPTANADYWKTARTFRPGALLSNLVTLDEEGSSGSSPEPGSSKQPLGGMGPPARSRMPLNDRNDIGNTSNLSISFPPSSSGPDVYRPTLAPIGKGKPLSPMPVSGTTGPRPSLSFGPGPSGAGPSRGRMSSIGPTRTIRTKARSSIAPGMGSSQPPSYNGSGNITFSGFSDHPGDSSTFNALGGGAQRIFGSAAAPTKSSLSRRTSTLNLSAPPAEPMGSLRGPRPSMSMTNLKPTASRQSVQGLFKGLGTAAPRCM